MPPAAGPSRPDGSTNLLGASGSVTTVTVRHGARRRCVSRVLAKFQAICSSCAGIGIAEGWNMTTQSHRRHRSFTARGLTLATLLLAGTVHAKLVAAPGPDGAPPDPQTEAAVDALNDAIADGPDDGQSVDEWMME